MITAKNTVISPNFLVWKFCGKAQFPHSFGRFARNYAETVFPQDFHTRKLDEITVFFAVDRIGINRSDIKFLGLSLKNIIASQ